MVTYVMAVIDGLDRGMYKTGVDYDRVGYTAAAE